MTIWAHSAADETQKVSWVHLTDFLWMPLQWMAKPPPSVWDHLDRRERQFITPHCGKDKPHLMKQPGQSCIKSHRTVSCSAICTPPLSPQWVSGTADTAQLVKEQVHHCWQPGLLFRNTVTSDEWYHCCEIWQISRHRYLCRIQLVANKFPQAGQ